MIASLLVALALGAGQAESTKAVRWHQPVCRRCRRAHRMKARATPPVVTPRPGATPTPTPVPPRYPSRTSVDLTESDTDGWKVTPAYRTLAAGTVEFNASNLGEDDHDFSVRIGSTVLVTVPIAPGEAGTARLVMGPGVYTLFCSLPGHEQLGMKTDVTIR
jgi:plastocyanin